VSIPVEGSPGWGRHQGYARSPARRRQPGRHHNHRVVLPPLLFCDLDNTLIDRATGYRAWAEHFAGALGRGPRGCRMAGGHRPRRMRAREPIFEEIRSRWALDDSVADLIRRYAGYRASCRRSPPGCRAASPGCAASGWRLPWSPTDPVPAGKGRGVRLLPLIDAVVISDEIGEQAGPSHLP